MTVKGRRPDDVSLACSNAVSPILLSFAKKGQHSAGFVGQQISRMIYKLGAMYAAFLTYLVSALTQGPWGMLLGLGLCGCFSAVLTASTYMLGRAIAHRVEEVIWTTDDSGQDRRLRFSYGELCDLPDPVQRYFKFCMPEGQPRIKYCHIKQTGHFRLRENPGLASTEGWKKVRAQQYFSTEEPAFCWAAYIWFAPFVWVRGWDSYIRGKGNTFFRILSCFTVIDNDGSDLDQSNLVRYLSEACYYPTALLPSHRLRWAPVDSHHAKATLTHGKQQVSGVFEFDDEGRMVSMKSKDRCRRLSDGSVSYDEWAGYYRQYEEKAGIMIPLELECVWKLIGGPFRYAKLLVTDYKCYSRIHRTSMGSRT